MHLEEEVINQSNCFDNGNNLLVKDQHLKPDPADIASQLIMQCSSEKIH
jgi:hypothetical protein